MTGSEVFAQLCSEVFAQRPSTAPSFGSSRPLTMLRTEPDPWQIKKKQWLTAQHIRAQAVRRYTNGPSVRTASNLLVGL